MSDDFDPFSEAPAASSSSAPSNNLSLGTNEVTGDDLFEAPVGAKSSSSAAASNELFGSSSTLSAPVAAVATSSSSSSAFDAPAADDALVAWQEEHNKFLDEKIAKENADAQRVREKAREAYDAFLQQRQKLKEGNRKANRDAEASFVEARDKALTSGETWSRVAFFCETQLKGGEGKDISRMRDLLIQLKNS